MAHIPASLREYVTRRAAGHCEYCKAPAEIVLAFEIDHIIPEAAGGETTEDNLCVACGLCNGSKYAFLTGIDPQTGDEARLYDPRKQRWHEHFAWNEHFTLVVGLSPCGRATVARLKMNRERIVRARQRWVLAGWHPPTE
jgi:hypothetical protein